MPERNTTMPLVEVRALRKTYVQRGGFLGKRFVVEALRGVNLALVPGARVAIVGESGSGKSTLAKCLAGIEGCDSGEIWLEGRHLTAAAGKRRMAVFRSVQLVFQDSASSLNPTFTAEEIVAEPLVIARSGTPRERHQRAHHLMEQVGLSPETAQRRPLEFSGGQRQRLAIARALAVQPKLIIFDEALSGLDLLTRAQIVRLLKDLQALHGLTYLQITHDLDLARQWSDEIVVMSRGEIIARETSPQFTAAIAATRAAPAMSETQPVPVGVKE